MTLSEWLLSGGCQDARPPSSGHDSTDVCVSAEPLRLSCLSCRVIQEVTFSVWLKDYYFIFLSLKDIVSSPSFPLTPPPHRPRSRLMSPQPLWFISPEMFSLIPQINLTPAPPSALTSSSSQDNSTFINLCSLTEGEDEASQGSRGGAPANTPCGHAARLRLQPTALSPCSLPGCRFFFFRTCTT